LYVPAVQSAQLPAEPPPQPLIPRGEVNEINENNSGKDGLYNMCMCVYVRVEQHARVTCGTVLPDNPRNHYKTPTL